MVLFEIFWRSSCRSVSNGVYQILLAGILSANIATAKSADITRSTIAQQDSNSSWLLGTSIIFAKTHPSKRDASIVDCMYVYQILPQAGHI